MNHRHSREHNTCTNKNKNTKKLNRVIWKWPYLQQKLTLHLQWICIMKQNFQMIHPKAFIILAMPSPIDRCQRSTKLVELRFNCTFSRKKIGVDGNGWYQYNIVVPFKSPFFISLYFVSIAQNTNEQENGAISSHSKHFQFLCSCQWKSLAR